MDGPDLGREGRLLARRGSADVASSEEWRPLVRGGPRRGLWILDS
jgi:hypothetical protein